jgi:YbbR domain-containing protein
MVLYAGLVLSQNTYAWTGQVPIQVLHQPAGAFLLENPGDVTSIRLYAAPDVASQLVSSDFSATIDLSGITPSVGGDPVVVPVQVVALDPRVRIFDYRPREVAVRLDPIVSKTVPVVVDRGTVPAGLAVGDPVLSTQTVTVRGASSLVQQVTAARASVIIDPNGINVDADVDLTAVDARGQPVTPVDLTPSRVHVRIDVSRLEGTRTVPIVPQVTGSPANGYAVASVSVTPLVATVSGDPDQLDQVSTLATAPISVAGRTTSLTTSVALALPTGVSVLGASTVQVTVTIQAQSSSATFEVGVTLANASPDRTYALGSNQVAVTLGGPTALLDALDPATLVASADVAGLDVGSHTVTVTVRIPTGISLVTIAPARVTVVVSVASSSPSPSPSP